MPRHRRYVGYRPGHRVAPGAYLSRFLLTHLVFDVLIASAPARIVNVAGAYHARGDLFLDDLALERRYDYAAANNRAKLADVLFTHELAHRFSATP